MTLPADPIVLDNESHPVLNHVENERPRNDESRVSSIQRGKPTASYLLNALPSEAVMLDFLEEYWSSVSLVSTRLYRNNAKMTLSRSTGFPWSSMSPHSAHHSTLSALEQLYLRNVHSFSCCPPSSVWEPGTMHKGLDQPAGCLQRSPSSGVRS